MFFLFMVNRLFFFSPGIAEKTMSCLVYPFLKIRSVLIYPFFASWSHLHSTDVLRQRIDDLVCQNQELQEKTLEAKTVFGKNLPQKVIEEIYENGEKFAQFSLNLGRPGFLHFNGYDKHDINRIDGHIKKWLNL